MPCLLLKFRDDLKIKKTLKVVRYLFESFTVVRLFSKIGTVGLTLNCPFFEKSVFQTFRAIFRFIGD